MNETVGAQPFKPSYDDLNELISLLSRFTTDFVSGKDRTTILDRTLASMLTLSNTDYGFIAENSAFTLEQDEKLNLNIEALRSNHDNKIIEGLGKNIEVEYDSLIDKLFKAALPVISNNSPDEELGITLLPGNPILSNYIVIPLHIRDNVIGFIFLGNRPGGFDRSLGVHLAPIANAIAALIESSRNTEQAYYDPLTGLPNERAFLQRYEVEASRHTRKRLPLSLLMLQVDHLNNFRNNYGVQTVEECIKHIANSLMENLRTEDCVVRTGPDKFVALLTETPNVRAVVVAEKLRQAIASSLKQLEQINPTLSIGLTSVTTGEKDFDIVMQTAQRALEKARTNGGNQVQTEK